MKTLLVVIGLAGSTWGCGRSINGPSELPGGGGGQPPVVPILSGMVFEQTAAGKTPLGGVEVMVLPAYNEDPRLAVRAKTDGSGLYTLTSLPNGAVVPTQVRVVVTGTTYAAFSRFVAVNSNTRFDIELVRPGTFTLSGVVSELTADGPVPLEGVTVYAFACDGASPNCSVNQDPSAVTDRNGAYTLAGLWSGQEIVLWVFKEGFAFNGPRPLVPCDECDHLLTASVDTQLDFQLVRR